jgi:hypothetical protein
MLSKDRLQQYVCRDYVPFCKNNKNKLQNCGENAETERCFFRKNRRNSLAESVLLEALAVQIRHKIIELFNLNTCKTVSYVLKMRRVASLSFR